jgi:hypothetical protein
MDATQLQLLSIALPRGERNATSVPALARLFSLDERAIREGLEQLVTVGLEPHARDPRRVAVVTLPRPGGRSVYVAETPEELEKAIRHIRSKAMANLRRARGLRLCREPLQYKSSLF